VTVSLAETDINSIFPEVKSLDIELTRRAASPTKIPDITLSDEIHSLECKILDNIYNLPNTHTHLDAFIIAILMCMRSCMRDKLCNFRIVKISRLQAALMGVDEDIGTLYRGYKGMEKFVWTLGFGAVLGIGQPERAWFVRTFKVCEVLGFKKMGRCERDIWECSMEA
jgi:hypothetical protein